MNKIGVICAYQFPEGMAPTIRILAYCKGLQKKWSEDRGFYFQWDTCQHNRTLGWNSRMHSIS